MIKTTVVCIIGVLIGMIALTEVRANIFELKPSLAVRGEFNDNIFYSSSNEEDDVILTILPGTLVEFQGRYKLQVIGTLLAAGQESKPIRFTVADTSGSWNDTIPDGSWKGIHFENDLEFLEAAERFVATVPNVKVVGRANSGSLALDLVMGLSPELVLMDYVMPDMNGIEATRQIKNLPDPPSVVILTLHDIPEYCAQAENAGADGFLAKVDLVRDLQPMIDSLFGDQDQLVALGGPGSNNGFFQER